MREVSNVRVLVGIKAVHSWVYLVLISAAFRKRLQEGSVGF